jgi:glutamine synthetase
VDQNLWWCSTRALDAEEVSSFLNELEITLAAMGAPVETMNSESVDLPFELVLQYSDSPLKLADSILTARQTIHALASRHGMHASFAPKPSLVEAGSGMHVHMLLQHRGTCRKFHPPLPMLPLMQLQC